MRSKEFAHDYRYFPDPDLLPVVVDAALREASGRLDAGIAGSEAGAVRSRFSESRRTTPEVLAATRALADYFEAAVRAGAPGKAAANWISTELLARLNESGKEIADSPVTPGACGTDRESGIGAKSPAQREKSFRADV